MKLFILLAFGFIAAIVGSPLTGGDTRTIGDAGEYVKIPDGFGGMKFVNVEEEVGISPMFNIVSDTRFHLFTRFNPTIGQELRVNDINTVHSSHFLPSRPTRVLIHGWQG